MLLAGRAPRVTARRAAHAQIGRTLAATASGEAAVDALVVAVDGFSATKAVQACPRLAGARMASAEAANLQLLQRLVPARILGTLLTGHPQLVLDADLPAWMEFLASVGCEQACVVDLMRASPEVFYESTIFAAGQLLLFARQSLGVDLEQPSALQDCLKMAAGLGASGSGGAATASSMAAVVTALQAQLGLADEQLLPTLRAFPAVLGWDAEQDLQPKLAFFAALGPAGQRLLEGTLWERDGGGWLPGLRSWHYSVQPKLQLLAELLSSAEEAQQLLVRSPGVLKLPVDSKLRPVLGALTAAGLDGGALAQLLRDCPKLLAQPREAVVANINFLVDAIGGSVDDLRACPGYLLLSLSACIGPRYYFLARSGLMDTFSDPSSGSLQLQRAMGSSLDVFLADAAQAAGEDVASLSAGYEELAAEWAELLGWCCDKAFASLKPGEVSGAYAEQLNLFYVLVQ